MELIFWTAVALLDKWVWKNQSNDLRQFIEHTCILQIDEYNNRSLTQGMFRLNSMYG